MAKNKTAETAMPVADFVANLKDESRQQDCANLIALIAEHTSLAPKMWGISIVGFGSYDYQYESGHAGSAPLVGMASRTTGIVFYLPANFENRDALLQSLGKHKTGKGCIYIKKLVDIDTAILLQMVTNTLQHRAKYA